MTMEHEEITVEFNQIIKVLNSITVNKQNPLLCLNDLDKLQLFLCQSKTRAILNSLEMMKYNVLDILEDLLQIQIQIGDQKGETIIQKIVETIYYIINAFLVGELIDEKLIVFIEDNDGMAKLMNAIKIIPIKYSKVFFLLFHAYQILLLWLLNNKPDKLQGSLTFLFFAFETREISTEVSKCILGTIQRILNANNCLGIDIIEKRNKIKAKSNFDYYFNFLFIAINNSNDKDEIIHCIEIIITLLKGQNSIIYLREKDLIRTIMKVKSKYNEKQINYYLALLLMKVISIDDIEAIIKWVAFKQINEENSLLKQIDSYSQDNDTKTYTVLILINLIVLERSMIKHFNQLNSINCFIDLLHLDNYSKSEKINEIQYNEISLLFNIIFSLVSDYDFLTKESNISILNQFCNQLVKCLILFIDNKTLIKCLIQFISKQRSHLIETLFFEISIKEIESLGIALLQRYYSKKWVYVFLSRVSLSVIYRKKYINQAAFYTEDCVIIKKLLDQTNISHNDKSSAMKMCEILSVKILMKPGEKELIDTNITNALILTIKKVISVFIGNENNEIHEMGNYNTMNFNNDNKYISVITLVFAIIERKTKVLENDKSKCHPLIEVLRFLTLYQSLSFQIIQYLSKKLFLLCGKNEKTFSTIFSNNYSIEYIIYVLNYLSTTELSEIKHDSVLHQILQLTKLIADVPSQLKVFIQLNGIDFLIGIITKIKPMQSKTILLLIDIFTSLSLDKTISYVLLFYKEELALLSYLNKLGDLTFTNVNEGLYIIILQLSKHILGNCNKNNIQAVEDSDIISHLKNEFKSLYFYNGDPKNKSLILLSNILSLLSNNEEILKYLLDSFFIDIIKKIMIQMSSNKKAFEPLILNHIVLLFTHLLKVRNFFKTFYEYNTTKKIIRKLKEICLSKSHMLEINEILSLFEQLIIIENQEEKKERLISKEFLYDLRLKHSNSNQLVIDKLLDNINISNNKSLRNSQFIQSSLWENSDLIKEYNSIVEEKDKSKASNNSIQLSINKALQTYYETILNNLNSQLKRISEKIVSHYNNIENECIELSLLLYILNNLAIDESNVEQMCSDGIISKLTIIIDNDEIYLCAKNQAYVLLENMVKYSSAINYVLSNQVTSNFFLKEHNKITRLCSEEISKFFKMKAVVTTKLIAKLTENKPFIDQNYNSLRIIDLCKALSIILKEKDIIINLLIILQNVISYSNDYINYLDKLSDSIAVNVWKKYSSETEVLIQIMNLIELLHQDTNFIQELMNKGIVKLFQAYLSKGNAENKKLGFLRLFTLFNSICYYDKFAYEIIEIAQNDLIRSFEMNITDYDITLNGLKFLNTTSLTKQKYVAMLSTTPINEYCMSTLKYYISTNKLDIIKLLLSFVMVLLIEQKNRIYFSNNDQLNLFILVISAKINYSHILTESFDIIIKLLDPSLQNQKEVIEESHAQDLEYNLNMLYKNINDIIKKNTGCIDILNKCCIIIENVSILNIDLQMMQDFLSLLIDNLNSLLTDEYVEQIELFLSFIRSISDTKITMSEKQSIECIDMINKIIKSISLDVLNGAVMKIILQLITIILNPKGSIVINSDFPAINKIEGILLWIKENKKFHTYYNMPILSKIVKTLCVSNSKLMIKNSNNYFHFLLEYANELDLDSNPYVSIIEDAKTIVSDYKIESSGEANLISTLMYDLYQKNYKAKNHSNLIVILQILSSLCGSFDFLKKEFKKEGKSLKKDLHDFIEEGIDNRLLSYQVRGVAMLLDINRSISLNDQTKLIEENSDSEDQSFIGEIGKKKRNSNPSLLAMEVFINKLEIGQEIIDFLKQKRRIKLYTDIGVIEDLTIQMEENLELITAKDANKALLQEMPIKEMNSIVRSCSGAFNKRKLFSKSKC